MNEDLRTWISEHLIAYACKNMILQPARAAISVGWAAARLHGWPHGRLGRLELPPLLDGVGGVILAVLHALLASSLSTTHALWAFFLS